MVVVAAAVEVVVATVVVVVAGPVVEVVDDDEVVVGEETEVVVSPVFSAPHAAPTINNAEIRANRFTRIKLVTPRKSSRPGVRATGKTGPDSAPPVVTDEAGGAPVDQSLSMATLLPPR